MVRINTILLVLLISMTSYLIIQDQNNSRHYQQKIKTSYSDGSYMDPGGIGSHLESLQHQLDEIQQKLSGITAGVTALSDATGSDDKIHADSAGAGDLMAQLMNIQQQLSAINTGTNTAPRSSMAANKTEDFTEKNRAGNALVDSFIDNGMMDGKDLIQLHQHFSQMEPNEQKQAMQRLVMAINEQRVDIDPGDLP